MSVALLIPVLRRPQNVKPLLDSIRESTTVPYRTLFIADPGDIEEQDAIAAEGGWMISPGGNYASKIRAGVEATDEPYVLLGADDIRPRRGWFEAARAAMNRRVQVVGLNDLIARPQRPNHATHFLMTREAAELPTIDGMRGPLCDLYRHWWTDDELIATATKRGMYAYCRTARVEHVNHPMIGGADDATYQKGRATARRDARTFHRRRHLWT